MAVGANYWYELAITLPAEITAGVGSGSLLPFRFADSRSQQSIVISYWDTTTPVAVWVTMFLVVISATNFLGARVFGEGKIYHLLVSGRTSRSRRFHCSRILACHPEGHHRCGIDHPWSRYRPWRSPWTRPVTRSVGFSARPGSHHSFHRLGFRYWIEPGAFNQLNGIPGAKGRFLAFVRYFSRSWQRRKPMVALRCLFD